MSRILAVGLVLVASSLTGAAQAPQHDHPAGERLGTVSLQTSCNAAAQPIFNRGVALLHSFEFGQAIQAFEATLKADPSCAMAEWGLALSRWTNPFSAAGRPAAALQQGRSAADRAVAIGAKTERERAYIAAVSKLYEKFETIDQPSRIAAYRDAMSSVAAGYPDDTEATIFYALAIAAAAPPTDKSYADLLKAGAMLETLIKAQPDHPGLAHYIIHSYDVPPLADRAIQAAHRYAAIAPSSPHALHMPSHTFTRVGAWQDSIESNTRSGESARSLKATAEELHAMDYRAYAYLQTGQDGEARKLVDGLPEVNARFDPEAITGAAPGLAGFFALAAIPARYALERGDWSGASRLVPQPSKYAFADALTYYAKAVGAARTGDLATARAAADELHAIKDRLTAQKETYWAGQAEIQERSAKAWLAFAEGRKDAALTGMQAAATLEDATEKSPVTPGPLAPARELVGEMLLLMNQPAVALNEFEATLQREPYRFRALSGAAKAASLSGNRAKAREYASTLLKVCERADKPGRPELVEARRLAAPTR